MTRQTEYSAAHLDDVDVIELQVLEALLHALARSLRREVEHVFVVQLVAADLRSYVVGFTGYSLQCLRCFA